MKSWWGIAWPIGLGAMIGLLAAGILLLVSSSPRGEAIQLSPPPTASPVVVDVRGAVTRPGVYELRLGSELNGYHPDALEGVKFTTRGPNWLRYQVEDPLHSNPRLLRSFLEQGLEVVSLQEVPRSLEQVYLQAINASDGEGVKVAQ